MPGLAILIASVLMQLALGGVYAWSAFVPALREHHALDGWQAGLIFGTSIAVFTLTMVVSGKYLERVGPRRMALGGALLYGAGYYLAGSSGGSWTSLWLGIGVLSGIGIGLGYVCPLTVCVRWYPRHKGLVTGIAVAGFGGGAIILAQIAETLLSGGWDPLRLFKVLGIFFWIWLAGCALVLRFPPGTVATQTAALSGSALWRDPRFRRMFAGMFCGTFGGLLAIGHLKPIALTAELSSNAGALAVAAFAAGNAAGRIAWGFLHDRFGSRLVPLSMGFLGFVLLGLLDSGVAWRFVTASLVAGFGFAACFVLYAAETASTFGVGQVGRIYPKIFLAYGFAGITGPFLGGWLYDITGAYVWPVATAAVVAASGAFFMRNRPEREPASG
ncbi:MAG TPA: MFS transporter [Kiritimatiellia bacterium]|nr:MFS transporter [Kiritimatiellia bacterium]